MLIKIDKFDTDGKVFDYNFTKDECYKIKTGVCALDIYKNRLNDSFEKYTKEKNKNRCVQAHLLLKDKKHKNIPLIGKYKCGHYGFNDGRHRICISQKLKLLITVDYDQNIWNGFCNICNRKSSLN